APACARHPHLAGRLRHRLFLAGLSLAPAAGPAEDRPGLRRPPAGGCERRDGRADHHRHGSRAGPGGGGRGRGDGGAARLPDARRLPRFPGLPDLPADAACAVRGDAAAASRLGVSARDANEKRPGKPGVFVLRGNRFQEVAGAEATAPAPVESTVSETRRLSAPWSRLAPFTTWRFASLP